MPAERLVDARTGLITRVARQPRCPGMPRSYIAYEAQVASTDRFASWSADSCSHGAALDDGDRARRAAIGEAVERYCGNIVPDDLLRCSYEELEEAGQRAVDPGGLALYSRRQYEQPGFPFVPMSAHLELEWITGTDLVSAQDRLVPAPVVYLNYRRKDRPATNVHFYAGIAAGDSREHAETNALEEVFERDAMTVWWLSGAAAPAIEASDEPAVASFFADPAAEEIRASFLHIPCSLPVAVVGVFLEDTSRSIVGFGAACRARPGDALAKALVEAVEGLTVAAELLDPEAAMWTAVRAGAPCAHPYRPYRADRGYRRSFRADYHDVCDLATHTQLYLDLVAQGTTLTRLREPGGRVGLGDLPSIDPARARSLYIDALRNESLEAISVDLTSADVRAEGMSVVRVIVPGLYSYAPAAFPFLGGRRLYEEPARLGWVNTVLTEEDLVLDPLPYS